MRPVSNFGLVACTLIGLLITSPSADAAVQCTSQGTNVQGSVRTYQMFQSPAVPHSPVWGWNRLAAGNTEVCQANLFRNQTIFPSNPKVTIPIYESNDVDRSQVTRVVFGVQAKGADSWHYWTNLQNTRNKAWGNNAGFDKSKVSVVVPQFLREVDQQAGAALPTDLYFNSSDWDYAYHYGYGGKALGPPGATGISTFDVADALINWIEARYPNVQRIVMVGHSLGAQFFQRYAITRHDGQSTKARLDYVVANAGSFLYPLKYRPMNVPASCPTFDTWPYGLSATASPSKVPSYVMGDWAKLGRKGLMTRVASRNVHIMLGSEDYASGTEKCEPLVQGSYHLSRGRFYAEAVINATGTTAAYLAAGGNNRFKSSVPRGQAGLPSRWSYDIVPGCAHVQECMYQSDLGVRRIMLDGFSGSSARRRMSAGHSKRAPTFVPEFDEE
ncbi:hypothetical protein OC846_006516 [Tilletia horrida]|uniref:AB hydrolase-1 domain-containing protein n=1 Tax=Tilletia horrida TaxID=155126 RepID=A0AAN6GIQ1_9BASI|nr:hypothetical protein OC845_006513 [Tilletia horrida]KAK0543152.1 hypothetical protein OC846_006516 [Tilletia horrida]KAK0561018.1 hypothetical protein OC861_006026 [Tilletia horrida]